ncbi:Ferredoxin subunit of nitrite reductase and ring-hydroxylating dioxygenase (plasmid) [Cupriavidus necator H850]|uniref:non-heme iron oxygenase ferredoxin subunit n=1 Tax=Cupriavidus necator TaxID=106590 RepID=UPI00129E9D08|nr:non-heme iron oxygenase ferredoxin subunit [Cupriavidus necator]KAI3601389.1 Ferredoxin subunit of nitrite reductase and ring-hydroxylating dioxygenase [Cupriavidus necator H850]
MDWIKVAFAQELGNDEVKMVNVGGYGVALYRVEDEFFATDGMCTHGKASLAEGFVEDGCIECPLHQGRFDIRTGKAMCAPVTMDLRTHAVKREGDDIYVLSPVSQ